MDLTQEEEVFQRTKIGRVPKTEEELQAMRDEFNKVEYRITNRVLVDVNWKEGEIAVPTVKGRIVGLVFNKPDWFSIQIGMGIRREFDKQAIKLDI